LSPSDLASAVRGVRVHGRRARHRDAPCGRSDEIPITTQTGRRSAVEDRWRAAAKVAGKGASIDEMRAVDPDLVEHETQLLGWAVRQVAEKPARGWSGAGRGHSPTNEAAVYGLVGQTIAAMGKGEGVLAAEDSGR
jgi:hypothetical protein